MVIREFDDFIELQVGKEWLKLDKDMLATLKELGIKCFLNKHSATPKPVLATKNGALSLKKLVLGDVPANHCVVFKDGDYRNLKKGNLLVVPREHVWAYSFDPLKDSEKCIRKHRESGYNVVVCSTYYGRYISKSVALECRNEVLRDFKGNTLKAKEYYKKRYRQRDILELMHTEQFELLEQRYGNTLIELDC